MIAAMRALKSALESDPRMRVRIGDATGTLPPFVVLWSPQMGRDRDASTAMCGSWQAQVGATFTADNLERALEMAEAGVELLTPGRSIGKHLTDDRLMQIRFFELRATDVGRSVTLPDPDSHPASVVALFDLFSQPLEVP